MVAFCLMWCHWMPLQLFSGWPEESGLQQGTSYRLNLNEEQCEKGAGEKKMMLWLRTVACDSKYLWLAGKLTID